MAGNEVRFDVVASDKASKILDDVADKAEKVEQSDPTVDVTADTGNADHSIAGFQDQLDKLTGADQIVVMALRAAAAQSELSDLSTKIATLDASDPTVAVTFDRYAEVAGQLDDLETKIKAVGDADPDAGANFEKATGRLKAVGDEATKTGDAVHSMAGNAIGDFAATATGVGPLGEALGQITEAALGGETSMRDMAKAGAGLALIATSISIVNGIMQDSAQRAADAASRTEEFRKALKGATDQVAALNGVMEDNAQALTTFDADARTAWGGFAEGALGAIEKLPVVGGLFGDAGQNITNIIQALNDAGISYTEFNKQVTNTQNGLPILEAMADAARMNGDVTAAQAEGIKQFARVSVDAYNDATAAQKYFTDQTDTTNVSTLAVGEAMDRAAAAAGRNDDATRDAARTQRDMDAAARHATDALQEQSDKLDALRGNISNDQAWVDLQSAFDQVRDSAATAFDKAKTGSEDADAAIRTHITDTNNLKLAVIDYGTTVLGLPADQVTNIVTHVDDSQLDQLEARLARIKANATINAQIIDKGGAGYGPGGVPRSVPVPSMASAAAPARWARINGRG